MSIRGVLGFLLAVIVAGVCARLGFWQLDRLEQRRATNALVAEAMASPPLRLDAAGVDTLFRAGAGLEYRRAVAEGTFAAGYEVVIRGRSQGGRPGVHLVVPLLLGQRQAVLVNRGWVPSPDANRADPRPFRTSGPVRIEGILVAPPDAEDVGPAPISVDLGDTVVTTYREIPSDAFAGLGVEIPDLMLQVLPSDTVPAAPPIPIPEPTLDEGPHLSYAVQWFSFGAIALIGFFVAVAARRRAGRKPGAGGV